MTDELKVGRREVRITHADRVVFPERRADEARPRPPLRARRAAMLPYVRDRPLALQAFPDGIEGDGYFMKAVPRYFPEWIKRATVAKKGGTITHVLAEDAATLVYLAGQNVVTMHTWLSRADKPHAARPGRRSTSTRRAAASPRSGRPRAPRASGCATSGSCPYAMTTGSRGVHVVCPLRRGPTSATSTRSPARSPRRWSPTTPITSRSSGTRRTAASGSTST